MGTLTDILSSYAIEARPAEVEDVRILALVQDHLVISTFPGHQMAAAIDLARVLCRALAMPVDIFRLRASDAPGVQSGTITPIAPAGWIPLAHVRPSRPSGVEVEIDPQAQE